MGRPGDGTQVREQDRREVVVTDVRIPFPSMVAFMVKWALASIPATFLLVAIVYATILLTGALVGVGFQTAGYSSRDTSPHAFAECLARCRDKWDAAKEPRALDDCTERCKTDHY